MVVGVSIVDLDGVKPKRNGSNFSDWKLKIEITLSILDLGLALSEDEPSKPNNESTTEQKAKYEKYDRSNRMSLMIMKRSLGKTICGAIPDKDNAESLWYMNTL
ncbi:hypothetical protein AMTR_s00122p00074140 [Amborella trichopoda]|uniref:Retrotransposon Copia-like N-terminal domain-containing protein n=1 Tax=Amborella trichopoda TaxID=13333 RepID=W1NPQ4_AMBTC|nr:hypothetical protein AMTR_s00122p00074140 [Amborella trichopoda]